MKLYAKIRDNEGSYERVVLCQFENENGDKVFVEEVEWRDQTCFHVFLDEGYVKTNYYYPVPRYSIIELEKYE